MKQAVINPANGEVIAEIEVASQPDVESAINSARQAFDQGPWRRFSLEERKVFLQKISQGILDNAAELARLETLNTGKPIKESTFMDVPSAAHTFEHIANNFQKYLQEDSPSLEAQAACRLIREPLGVVVLIVPWNYPLIIAAWKLASALAAGNCVILKPSSLTPLTAIELGKICQASGLPAGVVTVLNGPGDKLGQQLCADKRVDMISFTGSNEVGKKIIEYSSAHPKKMIMELGGKSAALVFADTDLEVAVNSALCSIFLNQGQMCTAMSRILVEDSIYEAFLKNFLAKAERIKLGPGEDFETQMGPLISASQRQKVLDFVAKAKSEGARLLSGGVIPPDEKLSRGFFFKPAVLADCVPQMSIFQEEVFGPVACIGKFSGLKQAIALANDSNFALAACVWTQDSEKALEVAAHLNAGTIWCNTYGMFYNEVPYGGFKASGFGKELGREGFLEYTRLKNIIIDQSAEAKPLVNYWYGF